MSALEELRKSPVYESAIAYCIIRVWGEGNMGPIEAAERAAEELAALRRVAEAARASLALVESLPSGLDMDADEENDSPDDMIAHIGGLLYRRISSALAEYDKCRAA